jgi:hypothetical protein
MYHGPFLEGCSVANAGSRPTFYFLLFTTFWDPADVAD